MKLKWLSKVNSDSAAAVIIGIHGDKILLTLRSMILRTYSGDPCFPGGKIEKDDGSIYSAAIREFNEEVDFRGNIIPICGLLPICSSRSSQKIYPFLVKLDGAVIGYNADEVSSLLWLDIAKLKTKNFEINHKLPFITHNTTIISNENVLIWGVTASMLRQIAVIKDNLQI